MKQTRAPKLRRRRSTAESASAHESIVAELRDPISRLALDDVATQLNPEKRRRTSTFEGAKKLDVIAAELREPDQPSRATAQLKPRNRQRTSSPRETTKLDAIAAELRGATDRRTISLDEVTARLKTRSKRRGSLSLDEVATQLGDSRVSTSSPASTHSSTDTGALDFVLPARPIAMELIAGRGHYERVIAAVTGAHTSVWIATANAKELMVEDPRARPGKRRNHRRGNYVSILALLDELAARGIELRLLHAELPSGPFREELAQHPRLVAGGLALRRCPRVHLKVVIVDGELLYLGSANWTGAGLGAKGSGRRNFELGFVTDDAQLLDQIQAIYEQLWIGGECEGCKLRDECPGPLNELATPSQLTIRPIESNVRTKRPRKLPMRSEIKRRRIPRLI